MAEQETDQGQTAENEAQRNIKAAEVEKIRAAIREEKAIQADLLSKATRPKFTPPKDALGVTAPVAKKVWDAKQAPEGFRLVKGGDRVVIENGQPKLITGKGTTKDKGEPKPDCAHVFWCTKQWETGEARNIPAGLAYQTAVDIVKSGGLAVVESRLAHLKGAKNCVLTDHRGYILPTAERGRFYRSPRNGSEDCGEVRWLVIYDDGTCFSMPKDAPKGEKEVESQATDILLHGGYLNKTPMVCSLDGQSFKRSDILAKLPPEKAEEYKRRHPTAMHVTKTKPGWTPKAQQTRVTFSGG
jgi:hypothetical protein